MKPKNTNPISRPMTSLAFAVLVFSSLGLSMLRAEQHITPSDEQSESVSLHTDDTNGQLVASADVARPNSESNSDDSEEDTKTKYTLLPKQDMKKSKSYIQEKVLGDTIITTDNKSFPLREYKTQATPNDPSASQWWTTQTLLPELWDTNTGSADTVLAIIDTGVALNHEEFSGRWHDNSAEVGVTVLQNPSTLNCSDQSIPLDKSCNQIDDDYDGIIDNESGVTNRENPSRLNCSDQSRTLDKSCNLVDDDSNGLVDDWRGWDFMNFDNSVQAGEIDPFGSGTRHATYVTAVAAGNANNNVGIAGVNWQTKILPIQALGDNGAGSSIGVARGIRYAIDRGADVISLSLGSVYPDSYTRQAVHEAITAGVIVVAASGNDGCNCISYPANYPEVVAVGALATNNQPASFSSYGANLDILAPGTGIYTASWTSSNQTSEYASGIAGTSLATPIVSGLIASLVGLEPNLSSREIIAILTENTNRLTLASTTSWSSSLGFGTLNAFAANSRLTSPFNPSQLTTFTTVSYGSTIFPGNALEPSSSTKLYQCDPSDYGTTRIYRLKKGLYEFYSASWVEIYHAESQGYSKQFLVDACAALPIDTPSNIRSINVYKEFSNLFQKIP